MKTVGQGVREVRVRDASGAFRIIDIAKFADAIYVLLGFTLPCAFAKRPEMVAGIA